MNTQETTDEKILDYIDGSLEKSEAEAVRFSIENDDSVHMRWQELKQINDLLEKKRLVSPSADFNTRVMSDLQSATSPGLKKGGIIILLVTIITILTGSVYMVDGMIDMEVINQAPSFLHLEKFAPESVNFKTINLILLFTLSILSLLLFDRAVLNPIFRKGSFNF